MGHASFSSSELGTTIHLSGELDIADSALFEGLVDQALAAGRDVVLDLAEVTFCDSQTVNFVFRLAELLRARSADVRVVAAPGSRSHVDVLRCFDLPGNVMVHPTSAVDVTP